MSRTCDDCGSSWDGGATFCGLCGGLLDEGLRTRVVRDADGGGWWRRPWVGVVVVLLLVGGAVAAVPRLSIERTPPVDGEIGVPEDDDLNAAPAAAGRRLVSSEPPEVRCTVDDDPVECVGWSRRVAPSESAERGSGWVTQMGAHVVAVDDEAMAVFDGVDGTRLWRDEGLAGAYPLDVSDDRILIDDGATTLLDVRDGTVVWSVPAGSGLLGGTIEGGLAVTAEHGPTGGTHVAGRDLVDGSVEWERDLPGAHHASGTLRDGRLLLEGIDGVTPHVLLDMATGEIEAEFEVNADWTAGVVDDIGVLVEEPRRDPADSDSSSEGTLLTGVDLTDGIPAWQRWVPDATGRPAVPVEGAVVVVEVDRLAVLEPATGDLRWELELPGSLVAADHGSRGWWSHAGGAAHAWSSVVVVHDHGGLVRAHDPATGAPLWERTMADSVQHVFAADDLLMVRTDGGRVTLLDPATGDERVTVDLGQGHAAAWDPMLVFHPSSGHATRIDLPGVDVP